MNKFFIKILHNNMSSNLFSNFSDSSLLWKLFRKLYTHAPLQRSSYLINKVTARAA